VKAIGGLSRYRILSKASALKGAVLGYTCNEDAKALVATKLPFS
jgi:hypothetical protein